MSNAVVSDIAPAIQLIVNDGIAVVTMSRPEQRNALTAEAQECMRRIIEDVRSRKDIDVLILTGSDGVFCAGGDTKGMMKLHAEGGISPDAYRERIYKVHEWLQPLRNLEIPVISAIDGHAYGSGFAMALCSDFVLASEQARFCAVFCRIGLIPDCGVLFSLPRVVGLQKAKEIIFTGRPVDALEARELGIVMEVHPGEQLQNAALVLARRLQSASRAAFGITKRIVNQSFDNDINTLLEMEAGGQAICSASEYHKNAVSRFMEKKPLRFNWET